MRVEFDECESAIGLHADLDNVTIALEEGYEVCLCGVRDEISDVDCRVVFGGLEEDLIEREWGSSVV